MKQRLQVLGSWVVRKVSGTDVPDTTSGFRALSREAALRINIVSEFTYTLESIIQAGKKRLAIAHMPIEAKHTRPSRLFGSTTEYVKRSVATILRIYAMYEPFKVFMILGGVLFSAGALLGLRYAYFWWQGAITGHCGCSSVEPVRCAFEVMPHSFEFLGAERQKLWVNCLFVNRQREAGAYCVIVTQRYLEQRLHFRPFPHLCWAVFG